MVLIGVLCILAAFLLALISWHGRVIQRGEFCKGCKFDLDGLDPEQNRKCPECGRSVLNPGSRRSTIRRSIRSGFVIAFLVGAVGIGIISVSTSGQTKAVLAKAPDPVVIMLSDWGSDEALDELVIRTSRVPSTMSKKDWDQAVNAGLDFQADSLIPWDPRWGQVLFDALSSDNMSDKQAGRYITNGIKFELALRDKIHPGSIQIHNAVYRIQDRMEPIYGGRTGLILMNQITAYGINGQPPIQSYDIYEYERFLDISNDGMNSTGSVGTNTPIKGDPGDQIELYFEHQAKLTRSLQSEPIFHTTTREYFTVTVVDPLEPLITVVEDPQAAKLFYESIYMNPLSISEKQTGEEPSAGVMSWNVLIVCEAVKIPVSLSIYLVIDETEYQVGKMTSNSHTSLGDSIGGMISFNHLERFGMTPEQSQQLKQELIERETVRFVQRTDPEGLLSLPNIDEVLGITVVFDEVPIVVMKEIPRSLIVGSQNSRVRPTSFESHGGVSVGDMKNDTVPRSDP